MSIKCFSIYKEKMSDFNCPFTGNTCANSSTKKYRLMPFDGRDRALLYFHLLHAQEFFALVLSRDSNLE